MKTLEERFQMADFDLREIAGHPEETKREDKRIIEAAEKRIDVEDFDLREDNEDLGGGSVGDEKRDLDNTEERDTMDDFELREEERDATPDSLDKRDDEFDLVGPKEKREQETSLHQMLQKKRQARLHLH